MAIATCPKCSTKLKVPDGISASVRCPKCQTVFKSNTAPAPEFEVVEKLPPPPPKTRPTASPPARPAAPPPPPPPPPPAAKEESPFSNLEDEDEDDRPRKKRRRDDDDEDERPRKKRRDDDDEDDRPRSKKRSRDDDDEDDRPRKKRRDDDDDDDEDDRPRSKKRSRDEDDDDEDDRPRKKKRGRDNSDDSPPGKGSKFGLARTGVLLLLISLGLYGGSMLLQLLFITIAIIGGVIPSGMGLVTGLLGLVNWVVGLVGLGFCIAGPSRARGLAIAAVSVAAVHLILMFIAANDSESAGANIAVPMMSALNRQSNRQDLQKELSKEMSKDSNSARVKELREELKSMSEDSREDDLGLGTRSRSSMRWADLTTYQTFSDKIIAILSYQSKGFSKGLLGMFTGLTELARMILIALLIGSLAAAAKNSGAESQSKLGWIIAASTGGGALLVMLLAFVIADSSKPDTKDVTPNMPQMPNMSGKSFEEVRRAQEEYQRKVEAEMERVREKQESAIKSPFRWLAIGEFLVLALHIGAVVMPALAAMSIYSSTRSGGGGGTRYRKRTRRNDDDDDDDDD